MTAIVALKLRLVDKGWDGLSLRVGCGVVVVEVCVDVGGGGVGIIDVWRVVVGDVVVVGTVVAGGALPNITEGIVGIAVVVEGVIVVEGVAVDDAVSVSEVNGSTDTKGMVERGSVDDVVVSGGSTEEPSGITDGRYPPSSVKISPTENSFSATPQMRSF